MEDVLDFLPASSPLINQVADSIFNPTVSVTAEDCGTLLGTTIDLSPASEGLVELSTNEQLTQSKIVSYLSQGIYKLATRDLHSCTAHGGICVECYKATFPKNPVPQAPTTDAEGNVIISKIKIPSKFTSGSDMFASNGEGTTFATSVPSDQYDDVSLYINGVLQPNSAYTLTNLTLQLTAPQPLGTYLSVRYTKYSAKPYFGYLANTYSGSIVGIQPMPVADTVLRPSLLRQLVSDGILGKISEELSGYGTIDPSYINYAETVKDPLEKAVLLITLYGIYANITV